jgi:hypothetical protein
MKLVAIAALALLACTNIRVLNPSSGAEPGRIALANGSSDAMDEAIQEMNRVCGEGRYKILSQRTASAISRRAARHGVHTRHVWRIPRHHHASSHKPVPEVILTYVCLQGDLPAAPHETDPPTAF